MSRIPPPPSSLPTWEECTSDGVRYLKIISNDSTNNDLYYADTESGTPSPVPFAQPAGKWDPELRKRWPPLVWDKKLKRCIHLSSRSPTSHQLLSEHDSQTKWSFFFRRKSVKLQLEALEHIADQVPSPEKNCG